MATVSFGLRLEQEEFLHLPLPRNPFLSGISDLLGLISFLRRPEKKKSKNHILSILSNEVFFSVAAKIPTCTLNRFYDFTKYIQTVGVERLVSTPQFLFTFGGLSAGGFKAAVV